MTRSTARCTRLWNGWTGTLVRALVAVLPIVWVGRRVSWLEAARRVEEVGLPTLFAALALVLLSFFLGAVRWRVLLRGYGAAAPPAVWRLFMDTLVGAYFNLMPGGIAGEAVRGYRARGAVSGLATSYAVLLVDRLAGLFALLALSLLASLVGPTLPVPGLGWVIALASSMGLALAVAVFGAPRLLATRPRWRARVAALPWVGARVVSIAPLSRPWSLVQALALSIGTQASAVAAIVALVRSLAPSVDVFGCARVTLLVVLLIFVPVTPGGFGQREAIFVKVFGIVGVPAGSALAASLATFALGMFAAMLGGLRLAYERLGR